VSYTSGRGGEGEPEDVLTTETLSRLYNTPVEVLRTSDVLVVVGHQATSYHPDQTTTYGTH
jgi:zinc/manganese transport system ATP-binding protein